jgi:hypothetical protein
VTIDTYACTAYKRFPGRCGRHAISTRLLDDLVWARIAATLRDPEKIAAEVERRRAAGDPTTDADLAAVEADLAEVARDRRHQMTLLQKLTDLDDKTLAPIKGRLRQLADREQELGAERAGVLVRRERWEAEQARLGTLAAWCARVNGRLDGVVEYQRKRLALVAFDVAVAVWRADHSPRWRVAADPKLDELDDERGSVLRSAAGTSTSNRPGAGLRSASTPGTMCSTSSSSPT